MKPREQREAIKSFVAIHLMNALDPVKMADKEIPKPSASMLNAALSFLKATDPSLGQPTPEEIKEQQQEAHDFVYRISADDFTPRPGVMSELDDQEQEPAVDAEGNVTGMSQEYVEYMRSRLDGDDQA